MAQPAQKAVLRYCTRESGGPFVTAILKLGKRQCCVIRLGFQFAERFRSFGPGSGKIVLDSVNCNGNEDSIVDCYFILYPKYCDHSRDVGVVCTNLPTTRIQFGSYSSEYI